MMNTINIDFNHLMIIALCMIAASLKSEFIQTVKCKQRLNDTEPMLHHSTVPHITH